MPNIRSRTFILSNFILATCSITQLFETLQPGSNGVLTSVDKIPKERFRTVALDMMDLLSYHSLSERKSEPLKMNDEKNHEAGESEQEGHLSQQDREEL